MKIDEKVAFDYLSSLGYGIPHYEPDGNITPDFSFGSSIGIEVRRLNQNYFNGVKVEGLEQATNKVIQILENCLRSFDSKYNGKSYWVAIDYKRPLEKHYKIIKKDITKVLRSFLEQPLVYPASFKINDSISLKFIETNKKYDKIFMRGITYDQNNGGWLTELLIENVSFCVVEKSIKIRPYKEKYKSWWLLLIDRIGLQMSKEDNDEVGKYSLSKGDFDKIIIIDPNHLKELFSFNGL